MRRDGVVRVRKRAENVDDDEEEEEFDIKGRDGDDALSRWLDLGLVAGVLLDKGRRWGRAACALIDEIEGGMAVRHISMTVIDGPLPCQ